MPGYVMERSRYVGTVFLRSVFAGWPVRIGLGSRLDVGGWYVWSKPRANRREGPRRQGTGMKPRSEGPQPHGSFLWLSLVRAHSKYYSRMHAACCCCARRASQLRGASPEKVRESG